MNRKKYPTPEDIAEMKQRGYDISVITEAVTRSERAAAARAVISAVRTFLLHVLDDPDYAFSRDEILNALEKYWK